MVVKINDGWLKVSLQAKWEQYLKSLADDHQTDLNNVINELCEWAFSNPEGKKQFETWLDDAIRQKATLKTKKAMQTKKPPRTKRRRKQNLKRKPTKTGTTARTENPNLNAALEQALLRKLFV